MNPIVSSPRPGVWIISLNVKLITIILATLLLTTTTTKVAILVCVPLLLILHSAETEDLLLLIFKASSGLTILDPHFRWSEMRAPPQAPAGTGHAQHQEGGPGQEGSGRGNSQNQRNQQTQAQ